MRSAQSGGKQQERKQDENRNERKRTRKRADRHGWGGDEWSNQGFAKVPRLSRCYTRRDGDLVRYFGGL